MEQEELKLKVEEFAKEIQKGFQEGISAVDALVHFYREHELIDAKKDWALMNLHSRFREMTMWTNEFLN